MPYDSNVSYYSEGLIEEAIAENRKKLQEQPNNHVLRFSLANTLFAAGLTNEAIEEYNACIELYPSSEYYNNLGKALLNVGNYTDALTAFNKVIEKNDWPDAFYNKAIALRGLEQIEDAFTALERALELNPKYREALNEKAALLELQGKKDEAITEYKKVIALFFAEYQSQSSREYNYETSVLLDSQELADELIRQLKAHIRKFPAYADTYYKLGQAYEAKGMRSEAALSYRKALEINPKYETARKSFWKR